MAISRVPGVVGLLTVMMVTVCVNGVPTAQEGDQAPAALSIIAIASATAPDAVLRTVRRPRSNRALEVMAGDELRLRLARPASADARFEARFKENASELKPTDIRQPAWRIEDGTLVTRTPIVDAEKWAVRYLEITESTSDSSIASTNTYPLRIAPPVSAVVEAISATTLTFGSSLRVTGQGFFAPADQIVLHVGEITARADRVAPDGTWFSAEIPHARNRASEANSLLDSLAGNKYDAGPRSIAVTVWGVPATINPPAGTSLPLTIALHRPPGGDYSIEAFAVAAALVTAIVVIGVVYGIYRTLKRRRGLFAALLLDPETQTYSLSRAQFFWWLSVIAYGYAFMFFAHGIHQGIWSFPTLEGFAGTFLISLGTLVAAQATSTVKGSKGAGVVHPSAADLIVHGGVLAPERVQQVVWTLLTSVAFLWIVLKTHASSAGLPEIPKELLVLMGLSSAGYIGGKLARKPGPVVQRVEVMTGSVVLNVFGQHLSVTPRVLIDNVELARDQIETLEPDPDHPNEFVKAIKIKLPAATAATKEEWLSKSRVVVVINADTQRAEWQLEHPTVTSLQLGDRDDSGRRVVTVLGANIEIGSVLIVPETEEEVSLIPAAGNPPTQWTSIVNSWPNAAVDVVIKAPNHARTTYQWKPVGTSDSEEPPAKTQDAAEPPAQPQDAAQPLPQQENVAAGEATAPNVAEQQLREGDQAAEEPGTAQGD